MRRFFENSGSLLRVQRVRIFARRYSGLILVAALTLSITLSGPLNPAGSQFIAPAAAAPDTTKPQLSITYPTVGTTITGQGSEVSVNVRGSASDTGSGIDKVWVRIDRERFASATPAAPNDWSSWSITMIIPEGSHSITAKARDNSGNVRWRTVSVEVQQHWPSQPGTDDGIPSPLRVVNVNSIDALMNAVTSAKPGDRVVLMNGVYDNIGWLDSHSARNMLVREVRGTAASPIVVTAETVGGAEIRGAGGFRFLDVEHLIIRGFKFTHSQDNSGASDDTAVQCDLCRHVRITRNHFELTTSTNIASDWLSISSDQSAQNRIDHNVFKNKGTEGVFVLIFGKHTVVDRNYFYNQHYSSGNGGECMRIGNSALGNVPYYSVVEHNLFENCNGDMEAVSVKSSSNTFRANTFRNNEGSLTFRHGNNNLADSNLFLNGENGLRSYGHNHVIVNNYFGSLSGSGSLTPLVIGGGTVDIDLTRSNSEHSRSRNVTVAFNTFYNNQGTYLRIGEDFRPLDPVEITVAHNILVGSSGTLINFDEGENIIWTKNILYGSASRGNAPTSGYLITNPMLSARPDGTYGIGSTSPAIDQASSSTYAFASMDMDGQTRSGLKDTGADEFSTTTVKVKPLASSDVGPGAA